MDDPAASIPTTTVPRPPPPWRGRGRGRGRGASRGRGTGGPPRRGARGPGRTTSASPNQPRPHPHAQTPHQPPPRDLPSTSRRRRRPRKPVSTNVSTTDLPLSIDPLMPSPPAVDPTAVTELSASISDQLLRGAMECLVCLDRIRRDRPIWSCQVCHVIVHLHCARKWVSGSDAGCPSCRASVPADSLRNLCFCCARRPPPPEPGIVPGSCGEPCLRPRGHPRSSCPHRCPALCHPGPCAPCVALADPRPCFCGRRQIVRHCGDPDDGISCGAVCGKMRDCGHSCERECHDGECGECEFIIPVKCFCGRSNAQLVCGVPGFSCGNSCKKTLACGNHTCELDCHEGPCPPCKFSPDVWTTCACGKKEVPFYEREKRKSCLDPLESCGMPCARDLGCLGGHTCEKICGHEDACGPCELFVDAECRCGSSVVNVRCGEKASVLQELLVCDKKCNDRLTCRQHNCQTICCIFKKRKALAKKGVVSSEKLWQEGAEVEVVSNAQRRRLGHNCSNVCDKPLQCGKHSCDLTCGHQGECPPCGMLVRDPLFCACGAQSIPGPVRCGMAPPTCDRPCSKVRPCGHPCPDMCHFGDCPPCVEIVKFSCVGQHGETRFVRCHIGSKGIKCHRACGRPLKCGVHACRKPCHADFPRECESSRLDGCSQKCGLARNRCEHTCQSPCHPGMMCPDVPCREIIPVSCPCSRRIEQAMCLRGGQGVSNVENDDTSVRLQCDDECTAQARLRGFASAVGRDASVAPGQGGTASGYSDFLLQFAESEPNMLAYFEQQFAAIVQGRVKKIILNDLPQLHRFVLHTLAEFYLLDSESSGRQSSRQIAIRHRGVGIKPIFPSPLLSEAYAQRELEKKRSRTMGSGRMMAIHVASSTKYAANITLEGRVEKELREHAGSYRVLGKTTMACKLFGLSIEFSTMERATLALSSLKSRPGVTVESGILRETISNSRAVQSSSEPPRSAIMRSSWNDGVSFGGLDAIRDALPGGSLELGAAAVDEDDIPDSWDD